MNDTIVTLSGWLGSDPRRFNTPAGPVVHFRLGATPRHFSKRTQEWVDGETQWYQVSAWRTLADNCMKSLHSGHPVFVHGRLRVNTFANKDGVEVTNWEIEASHIGHDLNRGHTQLFRAKRQEDAEPDPGDRGEAGEGWTANVGTPPEASAASESAA